MKKNKIVMSVVSGLLVAAVAVGGTLAYLSDTSNQVTNTFNVGSGYVPDPDPDVDHTGLWLDEADFDGKNEQGEPAERTETGNTYGEILPGTQVEKDPTFHMTADSIDSYVFAEVKGVDAMIAQDYMFSDTEIVTEENFKNNFSSNWQKVDGTDGFDGLWVYGTLVDGEIVPTKVVSDKSTEEEVGVDVDLDAMFNYVKLSEKVENADFELMDEDVITVRGVAVQWANMTMAQAQAEAERVLIENPIV